MTTTRLNITSLLDEKWIDLGCILNEFYFYGLPNSNVKISAFLVSDNTVDVCMYGLHKYFVSENYTINQFCVLMRALSKNPPSN